MFTLDKAEHNLKHSPTFSFRELSGVNPSVIDVTDSIKPIDEEDANLEGEAGEVVFQPNGQLHKILGKPHSKGGTPLNLPSGSFIFSQYKPLALSKDEKEVFGFKDTKRKIHNTPAAILKREVDIKHHNQMIAIQDSDKHDDISKKSSELMLMKNFKRIGQVAYLQEEKKGFPEGLPGFAEGTAPILNPYIEEQEDMSKQFQVGGIISPDVKKRARKVGYAPDNYNFLGEEGGNKYFSDEQGNLVYLPSAQGGRRTSNDQSYVSSLMKDPRYNTQSWDDLASKGYVSKNSPLRGSWKQNKTSDYVYTNRPAPELAPLGSRFSFTPPGIPGDTKPPLQVGQPPDVANPFDQPEDNRDVLPYEPNVPLTPAQKLSLGYLAYNAANIKKYYPKREQASFTPVNLERMNSQPYLNAINNNASQAYAQSNSLNPVIARAQNSQIYGKSLDASSQAIGNVANQNSQISNQENLYNNQGINRTAAENIQLDQTYYNQVQALGQNTDNEKRFALNRLFDQYNQYRSGNDALELQLASQPTFGSIDVWQDPKTGRTSRVQIPGWIAKKQAAPLYDYNTKKNSVYYTGAGLDLKNLPSGKADIEALLNPLMNKVKSGEELSRSEAYLIGKILASKYSNPYQ